MRFYFARETLCATAFLQKSRAVSSVKTAFFGFLVHFSTGKKIEKNAKNAKRALRVQFLKVVRARLLWVFLRFFKRPRSVLFFCVFARIAYSRRKKRNVAKTALRRTIFKFRDIFVFLKIVRRSAVLGGCLVFRRESGVLRTRFLNCTP